MHDNEAAASAYCPTAHSIHEEEAAVLVYCPGKQSIQSEPDGLKYLLAGHGALASVDPGRYDRQSEKKRIGRSTAQHVIGIAVTDSDSVSKQVSTVSDSHHIPQNIQQHPAATMTPIMKNAKSAFAPASWCS
jgi:hypothetical protein